MWELSIKRLTSTGLQFDTIKIIEWHNHPSFCVWIWIAGASCDQANGHCINGCANSLLTPTCKTSTEDDKVAKEAAIASEPATAIKYITFGLGIALVAIAIVYLCARLCLITDVARKQKAMQAQQYNSDVNEKVVLLYCTRFKFIAQTHNYISIIMCSELV